MNGSDDAHSVIENANSAGIFQINEGTVRSTAFVAMLTMGLTTCIGYM
jgi:hypothetical protein